MESGPSPVPVASRIRAASDSRRRRRRSSTRASRPSWSRALGQEGESLLTFPETGEDPRGPGANLERLLQRPAASMRAADARASSILPADAWACAARSGSPRSGAAAGARESRAATSSDRPERNASPRRRRASSTSESSARAERRARSSRRDSGPEAARRERHESRSARVRSDASRRRCSSLRETIGPSRRAQQRPAVARLLEDLDGPFGRHALRRRPPRREEKPSPRSAAARSTTSTGVAPVARQPLSGVRQETNAPAASPRRGVVPGRRPPPRPAPPRIARTTAAKRTEGGRAPRSPRGRGGARGAPRSATEAGLPGGSRSWSASPANRGSSSHAAERPRIPAVEIPREEGERRARLRGRRLPAGQSAEDLRTRVGSERFGQLQERSAVLRRHRRTRLGKRRLPRRAPGRSPRHPLGDAAGGDEPLARRRGELARDGEPEEVEGDPLSDLARAGQVEEKRVGRARAVRGAQDRRYRLGRSRRQPPSPRASSNPLLASPERPHATSLPASRSAETPRTTDAGTALQAGTGGRCEPGDVAAPGPRPDRLRSLGGKAEAVSTEKRKEAGEPDEEPGVLGIRQLFREGPRGRGRTEHPSRPFPAAPGESRQGSVHETPDLRRACEHIGPRNHPRRPLRGHSLRPPSVSHSLSEGRRNLRTADGADRSSGRSHLTGERRGPSSRPRSGDTTSRRPRACRACNRSGA